MSFQSRYGLISGKSYILRSLLKKYRYGASNAFTMSLQMDLDILMGAEFAHSRAGQGDTGRSQVTGLNSEYWDANYKSNINFTGLSSLKCIKIKRRTQ